MTRLPPAPNIRPSGRSYEPARRCRAESGRMRTSDVPDRTLTGRARGITPAHVNRPIPYPDRVATTWIAGRVPRDRGRTPWSWNGMFCACLSGFLADHARGAARRRDLLAGGGAERVRGDGKRDATQVAGAEHLDRVTLAGRAGSDEFGRTDLAT